MICVKVFKLVFSLLVIVYDEKNILFLSEDMLIGMLSNNYGYIKLIVE